MKKFTEICNRLGTDKGTVMRECHGYSEYYDDLFQIFLNKKDLKIFEIGINDPGLHPIASLKAYKEYFPNAQIFGLDIQDCKHLEEDRIKIFQGDTILDETYPQIIRSGPYDIIIDDGSHDYQHHTKSFYHLFPVLNTDGLYIIEDLHAPHAQKTSQYFMSDENKEELKTMGVSKVSIYCNTKMMVIEKRKNI